MLEGVIELLVGIALTILGLVMFKRSVAQWQYDHNVLNVWYGPARRRVSWMVIRYVAPPFVVLVGILMIIGGLEILV